MRPNLAADLSSFSLRSIVIGQLSLLETILAVGFVPTEAARAQWIADAAEVRRRIAIATVTEPPQ